MQSVRVPILLVTLLMLSVVPLTEGNSGGVYNQSAGCSCHSPSGTTAASVSVSGHPSSYTPGTTYTLSISVTGGVSGSNGGFSLEASQGTLSTGGIGIMAVKVNSAGNSATHTTNSFRSWSVDWTAPSAGSGQVTLSVAGLTADNSGNNNGDRWATSTYQVPEAGAAPNTPPTASNLVLGPSGATTTSQVTLSYTYSDAENDPESGTTIDWFRDGIQITNSGTTAAASLTAKHQEWYAVVTPSDGADAGTSVTSNTLVIANSLPTMNTPSILPSDPESDDDLSFTALASDDDQDSITYETRWMLEGVVISELDNSQSVPSYATRSGENWTMEVRANDGEAVTAWQTSPTVQIDGGEDENTPPTANSVVIGPSNPVTADDLTITYVYADADNDVETRHEIEWLRNGVSDSMFTGSGVPSSSTEKDQSWSARVRVSDGATWSSWTPSNQVFIGNTPPTTLDLEVTSTELTTSESATVSFTHDDVDGDAMSNSEVIWYRDGFRINALDGSLTLPFDNTAKGEVWTVEVRAGDGTELSQNSMTLDVTIVNSAPAVTVMLSEAPSAQTPLSVDITSSDPDEDEATTMVNWYRNGFLEASLVNQTTVPAQFLGPGQSWAVEVDVTDSSESTASAYQSITILNIAPTAIIEQQTTPAWIGELLTVDASSSSDVDGSIASYTWAWSDVTGASGTGNGASFTFAPNGAATINLAIVDDFGASASASLPIAPIQGPVVANLEATLNGQAVMLTWSYEGPNASFNIERNGALVGTTDSMSYSDEPLTAGQVTYTIRPVIEDVLLQNGATESTTVQIDPVVESVSSSTSFSGSIVGFLLLLVGVGALGLVLFERRE